MTLIVRGGNVMTPQRVEHADIVVGDDGRVADLVPSGTAKVTGARTIDAGGLLVLPGMIDAHVHFQEPGREGWEGFDTGSAAAAAGGVTTVVDMPIDCNPPTVTADLVTAKAKAACRSSRVDVALWGGLVPGSLCQLNEMADAGVVGFKAFACPSGWDEFPAADAATLAAGFAVAARRNLPVAVHCELEELGHSVASEVVAVRWTAGLALAAGARLHVVHVSSPEAVDEARRWPGVTVETCPHYLLLDETDGPKACCAPPIRCFAQRQGLWRRLADGAVNTVASDHSPCPPVLRDGLSPWAGIDGVGMAIPLLLSSGRLDLITMVRLITEAARILRLPGKGAIRPGGDADLALVDPSATWVVDDRTLWSRHRQSPYAGRPITGQVIRTLVRGRCVYSVDQGPSDPGGGKVIRPC